MGRRASLTIWVVGILLALGACSSTPNRTSSSVLRDNAITVGSFNFAESALLAEIYGWSMVWRQPSLEMGRPDGDNCGLGV